MSDTESNCVTAFDCRDKTDFLGFIDGRLARIDVTTIFDYKNLSEYSSQSKETKRYHYCIIIDGRTGMIRESVPEIRSIKIKEAVREHLRQQLTSSDKFLVDLAILHGPDYDKDGSSKYNPYQEIITVNIADDNAIVDTKIFTDWYIDDIGTFLSYLPDEMTIG